MADETKTNEAKISIKVIVDKLNKRVVYAEADHTFVDILFNFITLPLGTIVRLLGNHDDKKFEALGSLNNLYQSLKDLPDCYLATEECKCLLLNPRSLAYDHFKNLKIKLDDAEPIEYFTCHNPCFLCNRIINSQCTRCGSFMNKQIILNCPVAVGGGVFVSDVSNFIVTDDLCVMPYTAARSIQLLTDLGITDMSHLEGRNIEMHREQMLYLLTTALLLDSPLTHLVFGRNKPIRDLVIRRQGVAFDHLCDLMKKEISPSSNMVVEVSLQKSTGKVLFVEAKEDFAEFLFGFLSIPLGTVVGTLINGVSSMSCVDNILNSISNMNVGRYLQSQSIKDMLLKPHFAQNYTSKDQLFPLKATSSYYSYFMLKDPRIEEKFLKQSAMFLVTDDLVITPSSFYSTMDTLSKLKVQLHDIERYEISIGLEEGLRILEASLRTTSTLTNIIKHLVKK